MEVISDSVICRTVLATLSLVCKLQPKEIFFSPKKEEEEKIYLRVQFGFIVTISFRKDFLKYWYK